MFGDDAASKWLGAWEFGTEYGKGDLVEDFGSSYIALSDHTASNENDPQDANSVWDLVATAGEDGTNGADGADGTDGAPGEDGIDVDPATLKALSDRITALENEQHIPSGVVSAFNNTTCPTGWTKYTTAQGHFVIGLNNGGTLGYTGGVRYTDKSTREHSHAWGIFDPDDKIWKAFDISGSISVLMDWGDGIDITGTGVYPLARDDSVTGISQFYYTNKRRSTPPYVQLLYCEKS